MSRILLMLLLVAVSSNAMAEWVKVGSGESFSVFANPETIRKSDETVKMWDMLDFSTTQKVQDSVILSTKTLHEYDCKELQSRILNYSWYSQNMGAGIVIVSGSQPQDWQPVIPDSTSEALWKFACGKK